MVFASPAVRLKQLVAHSLHNKESMRTSFPTSNPELNTVIYELVKSVQEILKDNFVSAYLQGSFAISGWDNDSDVDFDDLGIMGDNWLDSNCSSIPEGNLDSDCDVDFKDYAIMAGNWLEGT